MLHRQKVHYSLLESASILRLSHPFLRKLVRSGEVKAKKSPNGYHWWIHRDTLLAYMEKWSYHPELIRGAFVPPSGALLWLGSAPDIDWSRLSLCEPIYCRSAYKLGKQVCHMPTWGIVIDLYHHSGLSIGREIAEGGYGTPLLIALTRTTRQTTLAAKIFDLVIPRPFRSTQALARAIVEFRKARTPTPRVASGAGDRFIDAGKEK